MNILAHIYKPATKWISIYLDGVDISGACYAASDTKGIALCYRSDATRKRLPDPNNPRRPARELRRGKVEFFVNSARVPKNAIEYLQKTYGIPFSPRD